MPVTKLTNTYIQKLKPAKKRYSVRDTEIKGLLIRVEPTGKKTFYLDYYTPEGKRTSKKIGDAKVLTIAEAREMATIILGKILKGISISKKEKTPEELTVGEVFGKYKPYVAANHKTQNAIQFIVRDFQEFFPKKCSEIMLYDVEKWRDSQRQKKKASSINRSLTAFRAMLRWARERDIISACPAIEKKMKSLPETDSREIIRYLSPEERNRLFIALDEREKRQGKDYLKPAVILSLNSGIRRKALLSLRWEDINFETRMITLRSSTAKKQKLDYVPLNSFACEILLEWKKLQKDNNPLVFPNPENGSQMHDCRSSWEKLLKDAKIENFRWHDMRHDFASQLVMKGIPLSSVRELLGHSKMEMTMRYAHLSPTKKREAVEVLDNLYKKNKGE
jgi:integrase